MLNKLFAVAAVAGMLLLGTATAAQADYVSPDELSESSENGWYAWGYSEGEITVDPTFEQCSIVFPENGGSVGYYFAADESPTGIVEVTAVIESFYASVASGSGSIWVLIDREAGDSTTGIADISVQIPVGIHGFTPETEVIVEDSPALGLPTNPTLQDFLDALGATGDEFNILNINFYTEAGAAVQWLAFGSETYWFGNDAEWFLNNPSCGTIAPTPTVPTKVETAVR